VVLLEPDSVINLLTGSRGIHNIRAMQMPEDLPAVDVSALLDVDSVRSTLAGEVMRDAASQLIEEWGEEYSEAWDYEYMTNPTVAGVMSLNRTDEEKACLLQIMAIDAIERSADFEIALAIAVGLKQGLSWHVIAQALGRSRQAVHRQHAALVRDIMPTLDPDSDLEIADIAQRRPPDAGSHTTPVPL
jgi:hypothetical protein